VSRAWARFRSRRRNRVGLQLVAALGAMALFADFLASDRPIVLREHGKLHLLANVFHPRELRAFQERDADWAIWPLWRHGPHSIPPLDTLRGPLPAPPGEDHPLGTDAAGRDVLARLIHGARVSLGVGCAAALLQVLIGLALGVLAGYLGGAVDFVVTRASEALLSLPLLLLLLAVQGLLEQTTVLSTILVIGLSRWAETCRLVRAEALRVSALPYVEASRALGSSRLRTLLRHVLPNCLAPAIVAMTFGIGSAILLESALGFLGFGAPEPTASWGLLMADGFRRALDKDARLLVILPGLAIFLTVSAFNLVGEGLREALDPRHQGSVEPSAFITSDQNRALSPAPIPGGGEPLPATYSVPEPK